MEVKNTLIKLVVAAAAMFPFAVSAQTSSINAFSPYTMYGIGEQNTPGTLQMRSMGGAGVAMRSVSTVNLLNPAAYSAAPQKTFLFNFGLEGQNYYNAQTVGGVGKRTAYNTFNFHDIAFQMPVAKRLGLGFSLTPYSSVGYRTKYYHEYDPEDPIYANVGNIQYNYQGEGDVTEVKVGLGWEPFKNFSVGIAAQYYWGDIDRTFVMTPTAITGEGTFTSTVGQDNYSISSIKGQVGVQWNAILNAKRILTFGATYDFGGDLNPEVTKKLYIGDLYNTVVKGDTTHLKLVLPRQLAVGAYYQTGRWAVGVDYVFQNWGGRNSGYEMTGTSGSGENKTEYKVAYTNTSTIKMGVEYPEPLRCASLPQTLVLPCGFPLRSLQPDVQRGQARAVRRDGGHRHSGEARCLLGHRHRRRVRSPRLQHRRPPGAGPAAVFQVCDRLHALRGTDGERRILVHALQVRLM